MPSRKRVAVKASKPVPPRRSPTPRGVDREAVEATRPKRDAKNPFELEPLTYLRGLVRDIPDFPKPGILFKDITPLLGDPRGFAITIDGLSERFVGRQVDAVVAIESRGFIFGGALAARLGVRFAPVRKAGKLPYHTDRVSYALEYGEATLELHRDALEPGMRVVVIDDVLATGGTASAAAELVAKQRARVVAQAFVIELGFLGGRARLAPTPVVSLLRYD